MELIETYMPDLQVGKPLDSQPKESIRLLVRPIYGISGTGAIASNASTCIRRGISRSQEGLVWICVFVRLIGVSLLCTKPNTLVEKRSHEIDQPFLVQEIPGKLLVIARSHTLYFVCIVL